MHERSSSHPIKFRDQEFPSKAAAALAYNLTYRQVSRVKQKYELKSYSAALNASIAFQKVRSKISITEREHILIKACEARREKGTKRPPGPKGEPLIKSVIMYDNQIYESYAELCNALHLNYDTMRSIRSKNKISLAEAIEVALVRRKKTEIKAFGTVYASCAELARHKKIDVERLRKSLKDRGDTTVEEVVKSLKEPKPKVSLKELPLNPVMFGWKFNSWKAAWEYWMPYGVNRQKFYEHLREGHNIDARCQHELIKHAENGNLTNDLRRVDQLSWSPKNGGPIECVDPLRQESLRQKLSKYKLKKPSTKKAHMPSIKKSTKSSADVIDSI